MNPIVIASAKRTALGKFNGQFTTCTATQLGAAAIRATLESCELDTKAIDSVIMGCVLPAGLGQAPARQASILARLSDHTPCTTVNKVCGSGMQSVIFAHDAIKAGSHKLIIAGGMENMSLSPYLLPKARQGFRFGHQQLLDHMLLDGLEDAYDKGCSMGLFAENCAKENNISRQMQDDYALTSIERAREAMQQGYFSEQIAPVQVQRKKETLSITKDEGPFSVDPAKIPKLPPAFSKNGTITAANASAIADGAAALIISDQYTAQQHQLPTIAKIIGHASFAAKPADFPTAPIGAISRLLKKIGWQKKQVDLWEINEAFAVVPLACIQALKLDPEQVNIHGGACILGHPLGASGARILVTLIHALKQSGKQRGIASLCIGGGEATAIAVEIC